MFRSLRFRLAVAYVFATTLTFVLPAFSTKPKATLTDNLTKQSDVIVVGKVGHLTSAWTEGKKMIETRVSVSVDQTIKGSIEERSITVVVPGGEIDGVGEWYSHTPRFGQDEDIVLFANKDQSGQYRVSGGEFGKVVIKKDVKTGSKIIQNFGTLDEYTSTIKKSMQSADDAAGHH